jgi:flagellar hook-associated protein 2
MGRITTGVGLTSGLDYESLANSLTALNKVPVDLLTAQLKKRQNEQVAYTGLTATLLSMSLSVNRLGQNSVLQARTAASSNESILRASAETTTALGSYSFRPVQVAQAQRFTSTGFGDINSTPVGAGTITIKRGGFVTNDTSLDVLNGGSGVPLGKIRLTDRSGTSTVVDLTDARTVDDVLERINENGVVAITADVSGDSFVLTDHSGQTTSNLTVQEVSGGTTAAKLGLLGGVAASTKTGTDVVKLSGDFKLANLNDGLGVRKHGTQNDFQITAKDGTLIDVELGSATTIQGALDAINNDAQNGGKVVASIDPGGDKLVLTDTTGGGGTLSVIELNGTHSARDLGILGSEQSGGVLTGKRVVAGLNTVLLGNLRGGQGIAVPGQIDITDRSGATATVDLTGASSLGEVVDAINAAGIGVDAAINNEGHGITLTDTTGASASNLIVADVGGGTTAADLSIAGSVASTTIKSGDLHRRFISENTQLSSLNGGEGLPSGLVKITDHMGASATLNINGTFKTFGDLIASINASAVVVKAEINDTGDGLKLTNVLGGSFTVEDLNGGKTAATLNIKGTGAPTINGALKTTVTLDADDTLTDAVVKLSSAGAPITASIFNTGGPSGFRILLGAKKSGQAGSLVIDSGTTGLNFSQSQKAQDAVLQLNGSGSAPVLFASANNTFLNVVGGLSIDIAGTSTTPVTVSVAENADSLVNAVSAFVEGYNSLSAAVQKQTAFDMTTATKSTLQGDRVASQLQQALGEMVGRLYGPSDNSIRNFAQLGITVKGGQLTFDESKLRTQISADPESVKKFFNDTTNGAATVLKKNVDTFTASGTGVLTRRIDSLDTQQEDIQARIDALNASVEVKRQRILNQFLTLEKTLTLLKSQQNTLGSLVTALDNAKAANS